MEEVKKALPPEHSIETTFSTLDEGCKALQIWNQTDYDKTDFWIAVFHPGNPADDDNSTYVYLYTHDRKSSNSEIAKRLGYEMQGSQEGYTYFRAPGEKCRFSFFDKERRKQLINEIVQLLISWFNQVIQSAPQLNIFNAFEIADKEIMQIVKFELTIIVLQNEASQF